MTAASEGQAYERAAALRDKVKAIERTMQSQKMAGFARIELDVLGLARQDNQAAVQLFSVRDGKLLGRDVFLLEAMREATDDEVLTSFAEQYYARASSIPREILVPAALSDTSALEAFLAERRVGTGPPPGAAPGREARAHGAGAAERRRDARSRARALARRPGPDPRRARGARGGARPARPADADRVLRHQHVPGGPVGRQHGRVRGGPAAERGVPPLPGQDRPGPERLREPPGSAAPGGSAGRRPATRAARRSSAGSCRTS